MSHFFFMQRQKVNSLPQFTCMCLFKTETARTFVDTSKSEFWRAHSLDLFRDPAISVCSWAQLPPNPNPLSEPHPVPLLRGGLARHKLIKVGPV